MPIVMGMRMIMRVVVGVTVVVRMVMAVTAGLAGCMVVPAARSCTLLCLLGKQTFHTFFKIGIGFGREVIHHGHRFEARAFKLT